MPDEPRMYYFGPWEHPGHAFFSETGRRPTLARGFPWDEWSGSKGIDGQLQPGCAQRKDGGWRHGVENEGEAILHHRGGWTALSFWDRSVDTRGASNSTYFAEGEFTFEEMMEMARRRFATRWNRMGFTVRPAA